MPHLTEASRHNKEPHSIIIMNRYTDNSRVRIHNYCTVLMIVSNTILNVVYSFRDLSVVMFTHLVTYQL